MGINACILEWFGAVADQGAFTGLASVLELGPQDFFFPTETLRMEAAKRLGREGDVLCDRMLEPGLAHGDRQALFYRLFGLASYASVDTYEDRATFQQDLNTAIQAPVRFDLIVDCGTTEHVFNAANVFVYTHNSLNVGGVTLKVLPTFGDNTHGFYNIHPTAYFDVARVNGYDVLDFRYIDDMISRDRTRGAESLIPLEGFQDRLTSFAGCAAIQAEVSANFLKILKKQQDAGLLAEAHNAVDYCFVAMRKLRDEPFVYPGQGVYLTEFGATS